jgi:cell division septation protein DedD
MDVETSTAIEGGSNHAMIRKLRAGKYRLYSRKKNPKTGKRRNLGTFASRAAAERHERAVQFFKRG